MAFHMSSSTVALFWAAPVYSLSCTSSVDWHCRPKCAALAASQQCYLISADSVLGAVIEGSSPHAQRSLGALGQVGDPGQAKGAHSQPLPGKPQFPWRRRTHPALNQNLLRGCYCLGLRNALWSG